MRTRQTTTTGYTAYVEYEYEVNGKQYRSTSVRTRGANTQHKSDADAVLRKFPVGARAAVYYNPTGPTESYLEAGVDYINYIIVISPLFFAFVFGVAFVEMLRARRNQAADTNDGFTPGPTR